MPSLLAHRGIVMAAVLFAASAAPALASDYFNACIVTGERYEINDDGLFPKGEGERKEIKHEKLSETILAEASGYCIARGRRIEHAARTSVRRIRFTHEGQTHELDALCELYADGLPAAFKCERKVTYSCPVSAHAFLCHTSGRHTRISAVRGLYSLNS